MSDKGRRASDRRRQREGDEPFAEPTGEATALHTVGGEWVGDESGLLGGASEHPQVDNGGFDDEIVITGDNDLVQASILAESERFDSPTLEETAFSKRPRIPEAEGARLLVIAGQDESRGQDLIFVEMIIGRSESADLVLRDASISREHASIRWVDGGFEIVDLGSETGTLINGRPVDRAALNFGDEIELGDTVLRFLASDLRPGERPSGMQEGTEVNATAPERSATRRVRTQRSSPPRMTSRLAMVMVPLLLVLTLGGGGILYYFSSIGRVRVGVDPGLVELLKTAQQALKDGRYEQAQTAAETFLESRPHDREAQGVAQQAKRQLQQRALLEQTLAALARGDLEQAQAFAAKLQADSEAARDANKAITEARDALRNASLDAARRLIAEGAIDAAVKFLQRHEQRWGDDEEADALRAEIGSLRDDQHRHQQQVRRQAVDRAFVPSMQAFAEGKLKLARDLLARLAKRPALAAEAARRRSRVDQFASAFARAQAAHRAKRPGPGLQDLELAAHLDRSLAPTRGSIYTRRIATLQADLHYQLGIRALSRGDHCAAHRQFVQARALAPTDLKAQSQLDRLAREADEVLARARQIRHDDRARARQMVQKARCLTAKGNRSRKRIDAFLAR